MLNVQRTVVKRNELKPELHWFIYFISHVNFYMFDDNSFHHCMTSVCSSVDCYGVIDGYSSSRLSIRTFILQGAEAINVGINYTGIDL